MGSSVELRGSRYLDGVWRDQLADFPDQQRLLHALARAQAALSPAQMAAEVGLSEQAARPALFALQRRDLVSEEKGAWRLTIPLFGRWLRLRSQM